MSIEHFLKILAFALRIFLKMRIDANVSYLKEKNYS